MFAWKLCAIFAACSPLSNLISGDRSGENTCEAMSSAEGRCKPLTSCNLYNDTRIALLNGLKPPYYFELLAGLGVTVVLSTWEVNVYPHTVRTENAFTKQPEQLHSNGSTLRSYWIDNWNPLQCHIPNISSVCKYYDMLHINLQKATWEVVSHDNIACGFPDGNKTLICCDSQEQEIPPHKYMLLPPFCGVQAGSTTRIVGGTPVIKPGTYPWLAELQYITNEGEHLWMCGGFLITERHVITAAHCGQPTPLKLYKVRIGAIQLDKKEPFSQDRLVANVKIHENYNHNSKLNDIAVVLLRDKVIFTSTVHPICLPHSKEMRQSTFEGKRPFIAGWGRTSYEGSKTPENLSHVQLEVVSNAACSQLYRKHNFNLTSVHLCAGVGDGLHDACRGDSGMPLMQPINNSYFAIGIISFGYYCAIKGYHSVNTRVSEYIDWIAKNIDD